MKKFTLKTLGCKTNQIESAVVEERLIERGFSSTDEISLSNYFILNSCSVTSTSDDKALSLLKSVKNKNPQIKTILTGCFAQLEAENLRNNPYIDILVGNNEKYDIAKIIENKAKVAFSDIFEQKEFKYEKLNSLKKTRATIKIQDGCNNRCAYCTIPLARGINRSNSIENIIEQVETLIKNGFKEVVLTGIHIGQWGKDFEKKQTILDLLKEIDKTDILRYRLGSLDPLELDNDLIDFLSKSEKFCPHFHISLQSACDKTLKNMNRHYTFEFVDKIISTINQKFIFPFIGSDIIVGFPGETEEDFEITRKNLIKLGLSQIHVFPYSKRKNTKAYSMPNQIPENIKKQRVKIIQDISNKKHIEFLQKNIGTINQIIIEPKPDNKTKLLKGVTSNYINVLVDVDNSLKNTVQKVKLIKFSDDNKKLIGEINNS